MPTIPALGGDTLYANPRTREFLAENNFSIATSNPELALVGAELVRLGITGPDLFESMLDSVHPSDSAHLEMLLAKLRSGALEKASGEFRFRSQEGIESVIAMRMEVVDRSDSGEPKTTLVHAFDMSEVMNIQGELRERLVEIESLKTLLIAINKSLDFDDTIAGIFNQLRKIIPFDMATVESIQGDSLRVIAYYGYKDESIRNMSFPAKGIDNPAIRAISTLRPIICNDVVKDFSGFIQAPGSEPIKSWLGIPLVLEGRCVGLLALDSLSQGVYTDRHVRLASNVAEHLAVAVEHSRQHSLIKAEARTDSLTGAANRHGLETFGQELFGHCMREGASLGILMLDIDNFKQVNDEEGHAFGDQVLVAIAKGASESMRGKDYLVRYGGEEFLIFLPDSTTREALIVAERLREKVPKLPVDGRKSCPTVSIGIFSGIPDTSDLLTEFIRRADQALYEAKNAGRNRCRVWTPRPEYFDSGVSPSRPSS